MDDQKRETNRSFSDIKMNWDAVRSFVSGVKTRKEEKDKLPFIIGVTLLLLSCGNSNSGKNDVLIDGGHGIGIDTTTVNEIKYYEDSIRTNESAKESTTSVAPSSSREEYHKHDNMRGFDPASEDDMDDNGMTRFMEVNDEEGWD